MKRLLLLGITMFAFAACTQNEVQELTHNRAAVPDTITVGFEDGEDATRIQLNEAQKTVWNAGDEVSVFYQSHTNMKWVFQGKDGDRSGLLKAEGGNPGEQVMDDVVIVYPYNGDYTLNQEDKSVIAMLPDVQSYKQGSYGEGGNIMVAASDLSAFTLRSVCGWLKVQLTGDGERVTSITLRGNGGEQLAGVVYVDAKSAKATLPGECGGHDDVENGIGDDLDFADSIFTEVTLDCGEGVVLGAEATAFYIALPPQTFEQGFTVDVECEGYEPMTLETTTTTTIERNHIKPMKSIKFEAGENTGSTDSDVANKEIRYTAYTKVEAFPIYHWIFETFGANIVAHEWDATTGEGVITFDNDVQQLDHCAFYGCDSLISITIPDSVVMIGTGVFQYCINLTSITIPDSVETIGNSAFCDCDSLTSVNIPDSVVWIGDGAFCDCDSLTEFNGKFASEDGRCLIVDGVLNSFARYGLTEYTIPDGVTTIGSSAFAYWSSMTSFTIPDGVTAIGDAAFAYCDSMTSVTIPDGVTTIGDSAFAYCGSMTSVTIPDSVISIGDAAFFECDSLTSITIPDGVTAIEYLTFADCDSLTSVTIPDSVTKIEEDVFNKCSSLTEFNGKFASEDGRCLIVNGVLNHFASYGLTEYTIPDSVTTIGTFAFYSCSSLKSITIPDSVTKIERHVFAYCYSLTSVIIPNSVTTIEGGAFAYCYGLTNVTIGNSVTSIGENAFFECYSLTSINIPDSVTSIENGTFCSCYSLTSITIPDNVTTIGEGAFTCCESLTNITIPDNVTSIGWGAFSGCINLESINIPDGVTSIGEYTFFKCRKLTSIIIPDSVTSIGYQAFANCSILTNVYCKATTPPTAISYDYDDMWHFFDNNNFGRKIYVPHNSVEAYKSAEGWSEYADDIVGYDF